MSSQERRKNTAFLKKQNKFSEEDFRKMCRLRLGADFEIPHGAPIADPSPEPELPAADPEKEAEPPEDACDASDCVE